MKTFETLISLKQGANLYYAIISIDINLAEIYII